MTTTAGVGLVPWRGHAIAALTLALCGASLGGCSSHKDKASAQVAAKSHVAASSESSDEPKLDAFSVPLSVNGGPARSLAVSFGEDGYSEAILDSISSKPLEGWHFLVVESDGSVKLTLALSHYPRSEFVLRRDLESGAVQAGLRTKGSANFVDGLVATGAKSLEVWDKEHLQGQAEEKPSAEPLQVSFGRGVEGELRANKVSRIAKVGAAAGSAKKRAGDKTGRAKKGGDKKKDHELKWWRLGDALATLGHDLPKHGTLVVYYLGDDDKERTLERPLKMLGDTKAGTILLKLNRRGKWKIKLPGTKAGSGGISVEANRLEIRPGPNH